MIYEADNNVRKKLVSMFENIDSTIVLSYLQGHMGNAWVDNLENPTVAQITVGIFVFYAGNPDIEEAEELLHNLPDFTLAIVDSDEWKNRIETVHKGSIEKFQRFRFKKNPEDLDRVHIQELLSALPEEYEIKRIDKNIAKASSFHELSEDFISQFDSIDDFIDRGVGYAILNKGQVVSAATSFSIYDDGIEIEVASHPNHRRKGLATIVASALILDCLDKGKYPSWDGANSESVELAKKLGYTFKESYDTYFIDHKN
ncbi:GNAT family N-acetyltransferase [Bacillus pseudomycoides]|uniref:GNAT family N-acetyltransferase n=1 Tax=Bacillus pseudomycoides TaxID=64104 RepID=A0AA91VCR2_9BACI|nr:MULTISPECIES: GNAT family N-acetyltransferase [Bacillus]PEB47562.1 GNAT family N-acetyltransferase [Bacillus sp. AFS098217]PED82519.1 GNAT family N-acetyltransferase [Bacillus pseudomycoides]PEU11521.1 GNAT family N-acetyltransferase [Bacillus sp. AFS014408]PEU17287.1 GNAT family N-acetyltransferase [Bacillus sp. AFS019443]PFW60717.1 GNAT family N-acetyltransferase [Bacillus sp. AFS075034]